MIEPQHQTINVSRQCELISLPRSSYYREAKSGIESEENLRLMRLIDEEYTRHPFYGSRKLSQWLRNNGHPVNRKRIQRLMRKMGLVSIAPKPNTSKGNKAHKVYPYLLKNIEINRPNQVWCTDITYVRLKHGFVYLVAIMDWYSRKVLSWEISNTMDNAFCISALERAIRLHGRPEIFNTDQGSQFTSNAFTDVLKDNQIKISMDGKSRWVDNVFIERLWRSVKYEDIYVKDYENIANLSNGLNKYFRFYNNERLHQSFEYQTPDHQYYQYQEAA